MFSSLTSGQQLLRGLLDRGYAREAGAVVRAVTRSTHTGLLERRIVDFEIEAERLRLLGERFTPENGALRALLADLEDVMRVNARLIDGAAPNLQMTSADAAERITKHFTVAGLPMNQEVIVSRRWNKPDPEAVARLIGFADTSAWQARIDEFGTGMADRVREIALRGIIAGRGPRAIAADVRAAVGSIPRHTAETMMRTLQLQSYRRAETVFYAANAHIISHRIRIAALDARTCMSCVAQHGARLEADAVVIDHENGRCTSIGVVKGMTRTVRTGEVWLRGLPVERQRAQMGNLAYEGWKAGKFQLSDFVHKYTDDVFGEMARTASVSGMLTASTRTTSIPPASAPVSGPPSATFSVVTLFDEHAKTDADFRAVLDKIDSVHLIPQLIGSPVSTRYDSPTETNVGTSMGHWSALRNEIVIGPGQPDIRGTIAHEMGHAMDFRLFGGGLRYGSDEAKEGRGALAGWWTAVTQTRAYDDILQVTQSSGLVYDAYDRQFAEYLLRHRELFARSYHQYIARTTGDPVLMAGITDVRLSREWIRAGQWTDRDFEPIKKALDEIFRSRGLLR